MDTMLTHEPLIQIGFFLSILVIMAVSEVVAARRPQRYSDNLIRKNHININCQQ